ARKENQIDRTYRFAGKWKHYGDKVISKFNAGLSASELRYFLGMDEAGTVIYKSLANSLNFQTRYRAETNISSSTKLKTLGEFSYLKAEYEDLKNETGFEAKRPEAGFSISLHHEFDDPIAVYALLRNDIHGKEVSPLMPAAGIEYSPLVFPGVSLKTNLSRNFNYPDLNDLYWVPGGNPDLKPEEAYSSDVSLNYLAGFNKHELNTSLTAHYSVIDNWILWKPGDYGFWRAENLAKVNTYGLEYQLNTGFQSGIFNIHLGGTYSFTRAINIGNEMVGDASTGKQLIYLPVHKANFKLRIQKESIRLNYDLYAAGKRFISSDNDPSMILDPYMLHDINISGVFTAGNFNFEAGLEIKNLLDKDYQVVKSRPMPGRNFGVWLKAMF
ncbi:MAG: TonB-dependent receptor domain-containing protein, partial [Bacteroidota bacterium]